MLDLISLLINSSSSCFRLSVSLFNKLIKCESVQFSLITARGRGLSPEVQPHTCLQTGSCAPSCPQRICHRCCEALSSLYFSSCQAHAIGRAMKSQLTGTSPAGAEAAPSLQEELVAAIHGAFEVAVEIAVREVKKLLSQASGDGYEEMRRENESLKQRLHRAEALLARARTEGTQGVSAPASKQLVANGGPAEIKLRLHLNRVSPEPTGLHPPRGDTPSAGHSRAQRRPDPQDKHTCEPEEPRSGHEAKPQYGRDAAAAEEEKEADDGCNRDVLQDISGVAVKVENTTGPYRDLAAQDRHSPPRLNSDSKPTSEHVTVKQEKSEEEICLDSIKEEDFNLECLPAVQSKMFEQWETAVPDIQRKDPNTTMSCSRLEHAHSSDMTSGLPEATALPSLSSDLSVFQLEEPSSMSKVPPQVYGVHVRIRHASGHSVNSYYSCKSCSQSFPLPSLLRRHYGQCQQKHSQQQSVAVSKRHKLQIYPPGCSPFRCTVCNREFNRMENLKTHLRIHTGERPYTCSVCSKCFRHSGALTRHFRIHTGEKPYVCGQCGKSFRNCGGLKFHERVHSRQLQ